MLGRPISKLILGLLLVASFSLPFFSLLAFAESWKIRFDAGTLSVFAFTFSQALASALVSLVAGVLGALGLIYLSRVSKRRLMAVFEGAVLLPNAVPVILLILAVMKFFPWARSWSGIVLVHALLNSGLVAVAVARLLRERVSGQAELAWIEGATGPRFFFKGVLPQIRQDLMLVFLFVFALCFSSFAVPLMLGGSRATTVEVLIYQKIRFTAEWGEALGLATLQIVIITSLAWFLRSGAASPLQMRASRVPLLGWKWGLSVAFFPSCLLIAGLFDGTARGLEKLLALEALWGEMPGLLAGSFFVGCLTGFFVILFLLSISFLNPKGWLRKLLLGYAAPSSVIIGFGLLVVWREFGTATYFKIAFGLSLLTVPSFYRWQIDSILRSIEGQRQIAGILGANQYLTFRKIVFPQVIQSATLAAGLASLWAWGDFALSTVVSERSMTIAMVVKALMESYRLDAASTLVWALILGGIVNFALFAGVGRVLGAKSQA